MPKLNKKLEETRNLVIMYLWIRHLATAQEIGEIFGLTTSAVYNIIKENSLIKKGK